MRLLALMRLSAEAVKRLAAFPPLQVST